MTLIAPDRIKVNTTTTGTGSSVAVGTAFSDAFLTPSEAGMADGVYDYVLEQGLDFEIQKGQTYDSGAGTLTRGTPVKSKVSGVAGTTKITLDGSSCTIIFPALQHSFAVVYEETNSWAKPQALSTYALTSSTGADFSAHTLFTANVNGSTFTIANPSTMPPDKSFVYIEVTFTTDDLLVFGSKYVGLDGYFPSSSGVDALFFRCDASADELRLVGFRNRIDL